MSIKFLGKKNASDVVPEMQDADVFVHSFHIENSPNSVCEAMMVGMPVVATYVGGTGALLDNYGESLLVQDGDPWSLSGAILEILNHPKLAVRLGENASNRAEQRHDKKKIITQLLNIYRDILGNKNRA